MLMKQIRVEQLKINTQNRKPNKHYSTKSLTVSSDILANVAISLTYCSVHLYLNLSKNRYQKVLNKYILEFSHYVFLQYMNTYILAFFSLVSRLIFFIYLPVCLKLGMHMQKQILRCFHSYFLRNYLIVFELIKTL